MDKKRLVMMAVAAGAALAAVAMPTKAELRKAQEMVNDVTEADVAALKAKSKTPAEVAAKHMELATQAGSEAEKYLLLQGAFKLYAKAGDCEGAANALGTMNREIADMKPEIIVEIYNKAIFSSMKEKAPKLHAIKEAARRQVTCRKQLAKAEAAVKANPKDPAAQKKLGECHAELGNWPKALDAFALADGTLAKTAKAELDGSSKPQVAGDFWWDYESGDEMSTYRLHAAELYRTALADDSFKGLARTRTEQRVKEAEKVAVGLPPVVSVPETVVSGKALTPKCKMVNGRPAPMKFELAKGVDLELEGCPMGKFTMGYDFRPEGGWNRDGKAAPKHEVVITRPFWVGKYQVTREQLNVFGLGQVMDEQMRAALNAMDGRGGAHCAAACSVVDAECFCRKLTEKFRDQLPIGYVFRLPTDAEWEYASKAGNYLKSNPAMAYGVPGKFFVGSALYADVRKELIQKAMKWDGRVPPGPVGTKSPNDWGVYDAVGNGDEQVLDRLPCLEGDVVRCDKTYKHVVVYLQPAKDKADPLHYQDGSDYYCLVRAETLTKSVFKVGAERPATFRVCLGPDLVAEKKAKPGAAVAATTARPSDKKFSLAQGIDLEMVACLAGTFKMSNAPGGPNGDGTHEVKLTRAYWIASSCVTRAMYKAFEADYDKDEKKDGEKKADDLVTGYARAEAFASWLNKRFQSKLPRGYVFRLPSEAEWEYAMNTGAVARSWDFEGTLDTVRAVSGKAYAWKFDVSVMDYAAKESDPLRICSQNPAWVCRQNVKKRFLLRMDGQGCFRMAVGPDLVAEKKAKK